MNIIYKKHININICIHGQDFHTTWDGWFFPSIQAGGRSSLALFPSGCNTNGNDRSHIPPKRESRNINFSIPCAGRGYVSSQEPNKFSPPQKKYGCMADPPSFITSRYTWHLCVIRQCTGHLQLWRVTWGQGWIRYHIGSMVYSSTWKVDFLW